MNKPLWILAVLFTLMFCLGTVTAQTSRVFVGSMSNSYPTGTLTDTQLLAGSNHTLEIRWDGTGLTGNILTTNVWLIHGSADWNTIISKRAGLVLRMFVDDPNGTLNFGVTPQHMGWHKTGGSGDPDFGNPGTAIKEPVSGSITAGPYGNNASGSDTVAVLLGLTSTGPGWEPAINPVGPVLEIQFSTLLADHGKTICLDTITQPVGAWEWAVIGSSSISPDWDNGLGNSDTRCWVVFDPNAPDPTNMIISSDTLYFGAVEGDLNPSAQNVTISSDNLPLSLNLSENASWLLKSPSSGNTPLNVSVSVTTTGLVAGQYTDSIQIDAVGADNSPQFIYVTFDLAEPPPEIGVSPASFLFNAVADSGNPASQSLLIYNASQSNLNWSVTNNQSWLTLSPVMGTDSGFVNLSVDIFGLPFGDYFDVIEVTDPQATNNPVDVPVQLTIASDLPLIDINPTDYNWVIDLQSTDPIVRSFEVRNSGGGTLNFTTNFDPTRIDSIIPVLGTAPESVFVYYKPIILGKIGDDLSNAADFTDTIQVISLEASNSPVAVTIRQRVVFNPAMISLSLDTVKFQVFECDQGYGVNLPTGSFEVNNVGGDTVIMNVGVEFESPLFEMTSPNNQDVPAVFSFTAFETNLPVGIYYDTIMVSSMWAINKPQMVIVEYDHSAGIDPPEIILIDDSLTIPYQQDSGPQAVAAVEIYNRFGGCMPWQIIGGPSWLTVNTTSGDVPGSTDFIIDPVGFGLGEYIGAVLVESPGAVNSPLTLPIILQVWKERGDVNWNGKLTIQDIVMLTDYLLASGNPPRPVLTVGDTNCDSQISVVDITRLIDRLFISLQPICGNT